MKRTLICITILLIGLNLIACEPAKFYFDYKELKETVVQVDLIYYDNPDAEYLYNEPEKVKDFEFSKMKIVETLTEEKLDMYLFELSSSWLEYGGKYLDSPKGYCVRILYKNGSFEILGYQFGSSYYSDGKVNRVIGAGGGSLLIERYFETQL